MSDLLGAISSIGSSQPAVGPRAAQGVSFKDMLMEQIGRIDQLQGDADRAVSALSVGRGADVSGVVLAQHRADAAFDALLRVHDTLQRAYEEIKRVNV